MEAAVAEKEAGMTEWNDGRLDDLSDRVDRIETKMDAGFRQVHVDMQAINVRLDGIQRNLTQIAWSFGIGMLTLVASLIATQ
jgi:phosphosulfolactate synthase (CoM biosynthesis protein A)